MVQKFTHFPLEVEVPVSHKFPQCVMQSQTSCSVFCFLRARYLAQAQTPTIDARLEFTNTFPKCRNPAEKCRGNPSKLYSLTCFARGILASNPNNLYTSGVWVSEQKQTKKICYMYLQTKLFSDRRDRSKAQIPKLDALPEFRFLFHKNFPSESEIKDLSGVRQVPGTCSPGTGPRIKSTAYLRT